ncbi:MAG: oligosaccharyl transferase, archaeosortase A system-associated [Halobacteriota archaeon]
MTDAKSTDSKSVLALFRDWYHVPVLAAMFVVMLWIRLQSYGSFIRDGRVYFAGNDAWYHLRQVNYTVRNWPATMPFDPWTGFPFGTSAGQFGTLYDQLVATAALVVGLGSPSADLVSKTLLVAPAVFGSLTLIPTYLVGKRLGGRIGGLFGAAILMLVPGSFLQRGLVGFADHNVVEPFFQAFAVLALMVAVSVAQREKPVLEQVLDRDVDGLKQPLIWSLVAGIAVGLYLWVWPPGVLLIGIFGIYLVIQQSSDVVRGVAPEHVGFVGVVSMLVATVMGLIPLYQFGFNVTDFSLIQPTFALAVAVGAAFLSGLARVWDERDVDQRAYPVAVFGLVLLSAALVAVVAPRLWGSIQSNLLDTVGFSARATTRTIREAQPFLDPNLLAQTGYSKIGRIMSEYGLTFFTGVVGALWMVAKPLVEKGDSKRLGFVGGGVAIVGLLFLLPAIPAGIGGLLGVAPELVGLAVVFGLLVGATMLADFRSEHLFVIVWAAIITSAAFTQVRFNYYLAVTVAVMNAYLFRELVVALNLDSFDALSDVEGYQVMIFVAVVMLVITPVLLVPMDVRSTGNPSFDKSSTAWEVGSSTGPSDVLRWESSLEWMSENTPQEGQLSGANGELDYYGTYKRTSDFDYPDGSYGVLSWWDYGHWITVLGERIPNANPFQQGATESANVLLAPSEEDAASVLEAQSTEGGQTRYVMVDWQMATPTSKFGAPITWYDESDVARSDFYDRVYGQDLQNSFLHRHQRYYDSMMVRLYQSHGSRMDPQPVVVDWEPMEAQTASGETVTVKAGPQGNESMIKTFDSMSEARDYVEQDGTAQVGGIGPYPSEPVPALQHYRLVKVSQESAEGASGYQQDLLGQAQTTGIPVQSLTANSPSWVKTFERVPGATVEGSDAPANATVEATVEMNVPTSNSSFTYRQQTTADENGEFTFVLPYSTTGHDEFGPSNGYTSPSVQANGSYVISTPGTMNESGYIVQYGANVDVSEGLVVGAEEGPQQVTLERRAQQLQVQNGGSNDGSSNDLRSADLGSDETVDSDATAETQTTAVDAARVASPIVTL